MRPALLVLLSFLAVLSSSTAYANGGIPFVVFHWPIMVVTILPVILVEAFYYRHRFSLSVKRAISLAGLANILSTLAGIPVSGGLLFPDAYLLIQILSAPTHSQQEWYSHVYLFAQMVWFGIFFAMSVWIEGMYVAKKFPDLSRRETWRTALVANLFGYLTLLLCLGLALLTKLIVF